MIFMDTRNSSFFSKLFRWTADVQIGKDKEFLIDTLSMLLTSGMTVFTALEAIKSDTKSGRMKESITQIEEDIQAGSPLWKAVQQSGLFSPQVVALIRVGEASGKLSENLIIVLEQQEKDQIFKTKLRSALLYPAIVLVLAVIIALGSAWFVLPKLASVFASLQVDLPWTTRVLISVGTFLESYGIIVIPLLLFLFIGSILFISTVPAIRNLFEAGVLIRFPFIKHIVQQIEIARMGYILGNLFDAGIPVVESLQIASDVTTFYPYKRFLLDLGKSIDEGNSFEKSFKQMKSAQLLFPLTTLQLISTAEQTGKLPETFTKLGDIYTQKADTATKNLSTLLEPALLIVVALIVFFVAIAIISPIYNLVGGISQVGT